MSERPTLRRFTLLAWPIVEQVKFRSNWHIDVMCEHLQAVSEGELRRLVLNVPPRHMKSTLLAVMWPAWTWLFAPQRRWLFASYAERLSKRDSLKCRRIIEHPGGRKLGGTVLERRGYRTLARAIGGDWSLASDQNEKLRFENTRGGVRLSTSIGGVLTGEGGDVLVLDDPNRADEVESDVQRENVIDWLDAVLPTRLNDPKTGAIVVVQQRLHEQDATGHLLEQGGYHHLCLPAEYEPSHPFVCPERVKLPDHEVEDEATGEIRVVPGRELSGDRRSEPGELLWPGHFDREQVEELKTRLGSYRAAGQLQQRPAPAEGGILKVGWWRYFDPELLDRSPWPAWAPKMTRLVMSWDTATKAKAESDFTVGSLWGRHHAQWYLLRLARGRWTLAETCAEIRAMTAWAAERFPELTAQVRVENAANGPEVVAAIRKDIAGVIKINADRDKVTRAYAVQPLLEAGNVLVPGSPSIDGMGPDTATTPRWVQDLIAEAAAFPKGAHDDQVDSLTMALDRRFEGSSRDRRPAGPPPGARPFTADLSLDNV